MSIVLVAIRRVVREEIRQALGENATKSSKPVEATTPYLTIKEAAEIARLAPSTIRLFIRKRELRACQVGSRVIIKRGDLEAFLENHP